MDIVKVFIEEPAGLEALVQDDDPDAHRRGAELGSLDALLAGTTFESPYARAYLAGTHLVESARTQSGDATVHGRSAPRIGLTALADPEAFVQPLLAWAQGKTWTHLAADGTSHAVAAAAAAARLRQPDGTSALAVGPVDGALLATAAAGHRRDAVSALRAIVDGGAAVLLPESAHDGSDWGLFAPRPLRAPLLSAFQTRRAGDARVFFVPYQRARGEHKFYFEQWQLDALPDFVEEVRR